MRPKLAHYLAYTRPLSIPVTMVMVMTGWLASPAHARTLAGMARDVGLLAAVYSVLMWGGANAFNSAEDRDDVPVNLLPSPPPLPPRLGAFGIGLQLAGVLASAVFGLRSVMLAAVAAVTSVFYSWRGAPWRRGKEIPGVDNLINAGGCGFGARRQHFSAGRSAGAVICPVDATLVGTSSCGGRRARPAERSHGSLTKGHSL